MALSLRGLLLHCLVEGLGLLLIVVKGCLLRRAFFLGTSTLLWGGGIFVLIPASVSIAATLLRGGLDGRAGRGGSFLSLQLLKVLARIGREVSKMLSKRWSNKNSARVLSAWKAM